MQGRLLTAAEIAEFTEHLVLEERSAATVEKYVRDVRAFAAYAPDGEITKETVIAYKKHLKEIYAVRSVNSMLASINCLFTFLGWHDLKVKTLKLQQQVYCPEEKELTKAEYTRLCRAAMRKHNERLCLILQTICGTGIRVSELQFICHLLYQPKKKLLCLSVNVRKIGVQFAAGQQVGIAHTVMLLEIAEMPLSPNPD